MNTRTRYVSTVIAGTPSRCGYRACIARASYIQRAVLAACFKVGKKNMGSSYQRERRDTTNRCEFQFTRGKLRPDADCRRLMVYFLALSMYGKRKQDEVSTIIIARERWHSMTLLKNYSSLQAL